MLFIYLITLNISPKMISHAKLTKVIPLSSFQEEVNTLTGEWIAHFNYRHCKGEWTVLSLRSPGGKTDQIIPDLINHDDYANTRTDTDETIRIIKALRLQNTEVSNNLANQMEAEFIQST